jgi:DinB superfamily
MDIEQLRFPIGPFTPPNEYSPVYIQNCISKIEKLPQLLSEAVADMTEPQLDTPYRPGGWTARQVIHHIADSHINSYTRFKLALTEDQPIIRPYDEVSWAELPDGKSAPIDISVDLIRSLHQRWSLVLQQMDAEQWQRTFFHPGMNRIWSLEYAVAMYAWHGEHHLAHVLLVK